MNNIPKFAMWVLIYNLCLVAFCLGVSVGTFTYPAWAGQITGVWTICFNVLGLIDILEIKK